MKTLTEAPAPHRLQFPDFGGTPKRINLSRIEIVKGLGRLRLRPIQLEDEPEMVRFHERISEESVYMRYFEYLGLDRRTNHDRLVRNCTNTPESFALVAEHVPAEGEPAQILAVGRLTKTVEPYAASFDTLIADKTHERAIRNLLLGRLITFAHSFGFQTLIGELLVVDHDTLNLCRKVGFSLQTLPEDGLVRVMLDL